MVLDKNRIIDELRRVLDPEIGRSIVELNMVKEVTINDGNVRVTIALTVAHCPMAKTLQSDVERALKNIGEVKAVSVETTAMSKRELEELRVQLQSQTGRREQGLVPGTAPGIERLGKKGIRNIIAVASGKGGVGKSFITSMLASELRRQGFQVGVLDADLTGPSIAKIFGLNERPSKGATGAIIPVETRTGIRVMSINLVLDDPKMPVIWRGPIVNSVIRQLYWDVDWGGLHFLLVDLPPGTSDAPLTVFQSLPLDGVIVVSSPQDLASMIITKAVNMAKKMDQRILGLIENMSYLTCPHCGETMEVFGEPKGRELAQSLGIPFLGAVPLDPEVSRLSDHGRIEDYHNPVLAMLVDELRIKSVGNVEQLSQGLPLAWG